MSATVSGIGAGEIDSLAVGRYLPVTHAGRLLGELLGRGAVNAIGRKPVELFLA